MNIHQALDALRSGKAIRRAAEKDRVIIQVVCHALGEVRYCEIETDDKDSYYRSYRNEEYFTMSDIDANDWEIYIPEQEKPKEQTNA